MNRPPRTATLHPTVFVAPGVVMLGDVTVGARSSLWFNTVVRGDSDAVVIGEDSNVQDNSVVHEDEGFPTRIGSRVTVGHRAIIHGCVIEDDCLIGMGSVVLTGARIGAGSLIGAASLVRERETIPPGSLVVGSPARVVGALSERHRAAIRNGSAHYAELARSYMRSGLARGADPSGTVARDASSMTRREWEDLLVRLEEGPAWTEARRRDGSFDGVCSNLESLDRRRIMVLEAVVATSELVVMRSPDRAEAAGDGAPRESFFHWRDARLELVRRLASCGAAEWSRPVGHPTRGARSLADWLREWVDEDLETRRALGRSEGPRP
ncbi:MAG: gamma carbonic anhydrase family protein [Candidatus Eisenbacteria bacterium]|uniref:Gamma carbonic anhydrase family protein n=1 Tax=Eiseniibacteriota bacterium TaxID=2212470 RepID=A0A538TV74_UNCEI|nr:MAG: gamma carbonic anhydrase family protein [Candidatus Eisenbacteria bacterium]